MFSRDLEAARTWGSLLDYLEQVVGQKLKDLNGVLFLIGLQELGRGPGYFSKEEKQDLMHIATCKVLSFSGYYVLEGLDNEGWPHWKVAKPLPRLDLTEQEQFLKMHAITYFENETSWKQTDPQT